MSSPDRESGTLSYNGTLVLHAVSRGWGYGFEIMRVSGLPSGTVYPLLRRMEAGELLQSRWEDQAEVDGRGRPRRRYYQLTRAGELALIQGMKRIQAQRPLLEGLVGPMGSAGMPED